jgi:hypothetical protein
MATTSTQPMLENKLNSVSDSDDDSEEHKKTAWKVKKVFCKEWLKDENFKK